MKWILACAPMLMLLLFACDTAPKKYDSLGALQKDQAQEGWVLLARFDEKWPATIRDERTADDEISLSLKSGARHSYPGYTGYTLKVMRLVAEGGHEGVLVFRTKEKR